MGGHGDGNTAGIGRVVVVVLVVEELVVVELVVVELVVEVLVVEVVAAVLVVLVVSEVLGMVDGAPVGAGVNTSSSESVVDVGPDADADGEPASSDAEIATSVARSGDEERSPDPAQATPSTTIDVVQAARRHARPARHSTWRDVTAPGRRPLLTRTTVPRRVGTLASRSAAAGPRRCNVRRMSRNAYHDHLRTVPLFADLDDHDLDVVGGATTELTISAGTTLMKSGSTAREMVIVLDGEISIVIDGAEVATVGPGGFAGEMGLLTDAPRNADVTAATDVTVIHLDSRSFDGVLEEAPQIAVKMLPVVAQRCLAAGGRHTTD
ncbi:MAG: cyclic nucleotide-binding domain-containing protein [Actinomycetota bacterium]